MRFTNRRNGPVWVSLKNGQNKVLTPGESAEVSPFVYTEQHPFVRSGWGDVSNGLYGIRKLMFMGASIIDYTFDQDADRSELLAMFDQAGVPEIEDIILGANVPGYDLEDFENSIDAWLDLGDRQKSTLVVLHGPGNSITPRTPYPTDAQLIYDGMERLCQKILNAGYSLMLLPLSYRRPEDGFGRETAAWNRNVHWPLIKQYCPDFWNQETGRPLFDWWQWTYDRSDLLLSDNVHPNDAMRNYLRGQFARRYAEVLHPPVPVKAEDLSGRTVIISFGDYRGLFNGINSAINNNEPTATDQSQGAAYCTRVVDTEGEVLGGVWLYGWGWSNINRTGDASKGVPGVTDINNSDAVADSVYIGNGNTASTGLYGLPDGLHGTLSVTATRASGTTRQTEFWQEGKQYDSVVVDARSAELDVNSFRFETLNGRLVVNWKKTDASDYGYQGVVKIKFD